MLLETSDETDVAVIQVRQRAHVCHVRDRLAAVLDVAIAAHPIGRGSKQRDLVGAAKLVVPIGALLAYPGDCPGNQRRHEHGSRRQGRTNDLMILPEAIVRWRTRPVMTVA